MKIRRVFAVVLIVALTLAISGVASADEVNPFTAIGNLTEMLYMFIVLVGVIFLALGIFQFAMALKEQDPSRRHHAILSIGGGVLIVGIRFLVQYIMGAGA